MNFIKRLLGIAEPDLGRILGSFKRTLGDLKTHVDYHKAEAEKKRWEAAALYASVASHEDQATTAQTVFANISTLVGA